MGVVISLDGEREKPSLDGLTELVANDLRDVNELIIRHMDSSVGLIPQLARSAKQSWQVTDETYAETTPPSAVPAQEPPLARRAVRASASA